MNTFGQAVSEQNFALVSRYIGWGDPSDRGLWFIGIEEGSYIYEDREDILRRVGEGRVTQDGEITYWENPNEPLAKATDQSRFLHHGWAAVHIPSWASKIASSISRGCKLGWESEWRQYRERKLWTPGSKVFNANLFPLPRPRTKDRPSRYEQLFGVNLDSPNAYIEQCSERHRWLRDFWNKKRPEATICFGKANWNVFKKVLQLSSQTADRRMNGCLEFHESDSQHVILTPFFGRGMNTMLLKEVIGQLKKWRVSIP